MRIDFRIAGLSGNIESRARLTAQLIAAAGFEALVSQWDGTRCQILVADADDAYGMRCLEQAARRSISTLALSASGEAGPENASKLPATSPAATLAKQVIALLQGKNHVARQQAEDNSLTMLALVPALASGMVTAQHGHHHILINRLTSRVYASSEAELLAAQSGFSLSNWDFSTISHDKDMHEYAHSMSLDAFCVLAAMQNIGNFPEFPMQPHQLTDWPDIAHATEIPNIFRLIRLLQKSPVTGNTALQQGGVDEQEGLALLWALKASGVLTVSSMLAAPPPPPKTAKKASGLEAGFLGKLMQRFGLSMATSS